MGAGAAAGILGGITVAVASPRPLTSDVLVVLQMLASAQSCTAPPPPPPGGVCACRCPPPGGDRPQPASPDTRGGGNQAKVMPLHVLQHRVHVTLVTVRVIEISARAATVVQAQSARDAVAGSYIAYASKNLPRANRPVLLGGAAIVPRPSLTVRSAAADSEPCAAACSERSARSQLPALVGATGRREAPCSACIQRRAGVPASRCAEVAWWMPRRSPDASLLATQRGLSDGAGRTGQAGPGLAVGYGRRQLGGEGAVSSQSDEDQVRLATAFQEAACAAGVPTPQVRRTTDGCVFATIGEAGRSRFLGSVDLRSPRHRGLTRCGWARSSPPFTA